MQIDRWNTSQFAICNSHFAIFNFREMPLEGVEPPPSYEDMDLNHARLPIPPQRLEFQIVAARHAISQAARLSIVRGSWSVVSCVDGLATDYGQLTTDKKSRGRITRPRRLN